MPSQLFDILKQMHFSMEYEYFMRMIFALGAGALVGIEREYRGRPAGMRTHILVTLGSALVSLMAEQVSQFQPIIHEAVRLQVDPGRIVQGVVQGVVTGIGFLGAGVIIKIGISARGLTTAASLWCMAIVGMSYGFGLYIIPSLGTVLMLFTLLVLGLAEKKIRKHWYKTVAARLNGPEERISELIECFKNEGWRVLDVKARYRKKNCTVDVSFDLRLNSRKEIKMLMNLLMEIEFVEQFKIK
jgi:putative Mg2+ transporter-C (MgtC) family protein